MSDILAAELLLAYSEFLDAEGVLRAPAETPTGSDDRTHDALVQAFLAQSPAVR